MPRAVKFYNQVLDLDLEILAFGAEKMACFPTCERAISSSSGFEPGLTGVIVSLNTEDALDKTILSIEVSGGQITTPKTKIEAEKRGHFATFLDSEGNKRGLYND